MSSSSLQDLKRSSAAAFGNGGGSPRKRQQRSSDNCESSNNAEDTSSAAAVGANPSSSSTSSTSASSSSSTSWTLHNLPDSVRLGIFQFAPIEDLAHLAMTCRQFREDCRHATLSQTRIATVDCQACRRNSHVIVNSEGFLRALNVVYNAERNGVFQQQQPHRRFQVLQFIHHTGLIAGVPDHHIPYRIRQLRLHGVTSLDLSVPNQQPPSPNSNSNSSSQRRRLIRRIYLSPVTLPQILSQILPQLRHVNLSGMTESSRSVLSEFARNCPLLENIHWDDCPTALVPVCGHDMKDCTNLRQVYMDNFNFYATREPEMFLDANNNNMQHCHPLMHCASRLERVSLLRATYYVFKEAKIKPFTQQSLIKLVRMAPNLQWFRSDLTPENIAILKQSRPEITFV